MLVKAIQAISNVIKTHIDEFSMNVCCDVTNFGGLI